MFIWNNVSSSLKNYSTKMDPNKSYQISTLLEYIMQYCKLHFWNNWMFSPVVLLNFPAFRRYVKSSPPATYSNNIYKQRSSFVYQILISRSSREIWTIQPVKRLCHTFKNMFLWLKIKWMLCIYSQIHDERMIDFSQYTFFVFHMLHLLELYNIWHRQNLHRAIFTHFLIVA